jgi:beta-lactamase superfamily II metal-dependent hydrolase
MRVIYVLLLLGFAHGTLGAAAPTLDVYFIDVGHGDAVLVAYGEIEWLIDTGYKRAWPKTSSCSESLRVPISTPIEYFIMTHPDLDHYSALDLLLCPCSVQTVSTSVDDRAVALINQEVRLRLSSPCGGIPIGVTQVSMEDSTRLGEYGPVWQVLHPGPDLEDSSTNQASLVLLLTYGAVQFLFTGDLEAVPPSLDTSAFTGDVLVLKAPHHGRSQSATTALTELLAPDLVVISSAECTPEVAIDLVRIGIPFLNTCSSGTIHLRTDGSSVWVTTDALSGRPAPEQCAESCGGQAGTSGE